ncbi:MAG: hypothetical protein ABL957_11390 [Parvularculaceae bacterium]
MAQTQKQIVNRTRQKVRLINFNDTIIEGFIFIAYNQRVSDLLNDDRGFIPVETPAGDVRVISKRAIMEIEILGGEAGDRSDDVVVLTGGNAYDLLGVPTDADDGVVRAVYLDKMKSISIEQVDELSGNPDLVHAARVIRERYSAAYDSISHTRKIEAIAAAMKASQPKRTRFGDS